MNLQPIEILTHILSYLDNNTLTLIRRTCHKWKYLIENKILYVPIIPPLYMCILTSDFYHFRKHDFSYTSKNWEHETKLFYFDKNNKNPGLLSNYVYYYDLAKLVGNKYFIEYTTPPMNEIESKSLENLLWDASFKNHFEVVKFLINNGAAIHANNQGALHISCIMGHLEIIKYLETQGANIYACKKNMLRFCVIYDHFNILKYLVSRGFIINTIVDTYQIMDCVSNNQLEMIKYLLDQGINISSYYHKAIQKSVKKGHMELLKYLLIYCKRLDLKISSVDYNKLLQISATHNHYLIVKYFISLGADLHSLSLMNQAWYMYHIGLEKIKN